MSESNHEEFEILENNNIEDVNFEQQKENIRKKREKIQLIDNIQKEKEKLHEIINSTKIKNIKKLAKRSKEDPRELFFSMRKKRKKAKNNFTNFEKVLEFVKKKNITKKFIRKMIISNPKSLFLKMLIVCAYDSSFTEKVKEYYNIKKDNPRQKQQIKQIFEQKYSQLYDSDKMRLKKTKFKICFPRKFIFDNKIEIDLKKMNKDNKPIIS